MKKTVSLMLAAMMLISCAATAPSAYADDTSVSYEKAEITMSEAEPSVLTCLLRSDLPKVPYINASDYLVRVFTSDPEPTVLEDGVFEFENGGYHMTIDPQNDTISFDLYEGFLSSNTRLEPEKYFFIEGGDGMKPVGEVNRVEFDLAEYDIDIVEDNGSVYLPFSVCNTVLSECGLHLVYKKGKFSMANTSTVMGSKGTVENTRTKEYAEYMYNELCFTIDNCYGKTTNALLSEKISEVGFDKALDTYNSVTPKIKELLLSESTEDYCSGLSLLQFYLRDGGHTNITNGMTTMLKKYGVSDPADAAEKVFGDNINDDVAEIIADREAADIAHQKSVAQRDQKTAAYQNFELINDWGPAKLYRTGSTFIFNLDGFSNDVLEPFKLSMDYAAEHGAKSFIIDITTNGGGDINAAAYMISLMCGEVDYKERFVVSGDTIQFNARIDKNLDGKFDEKDDEVKYDFRCAVLASINSYSCAHIFPCMARDSGICIIGEQTRGGSCCIISKLNTNGTSFDISGHLQYLRKDGSDPDAGIVPDVEMPGADSDYVGFFDIDTMNRGISKFYGDTTALLGDLDADGEITANDALTVLRTSVGMSELVNDQLMLADIDSDTEITANDALAVLRFSVGMDNDSKIGQPISA